MHVNWLDGIFFKCYEMFCITLCYVFVHFAGFVSDNRSKCVLIYLCIRDSIVCIDLLVGLGLVSAFFFLKGQNYVQTGISLEYITLDWFLTKNTCSINYFLSKL